MCSGRWGMLITTNHSHPPAVMALGKLVIMFLEMQYTLWVTQSNLIQLSQGRVAFKLEICTWWEIILATWADI